MPVIQRGTPRRSYRLRAGILSFSLIVAVLGAALGSSGTAHAATNVYTSVSVTADGHGYVTMNTSGQVYAFGTVKYRGAPTNFSGLMMSISVKADGSGYVAISSTGQVYAFGVTAFPNPSSSHTFVGISERADGTGWAAITSAGEVYAHNVTYRGNATGSTGIVGISVKPDGSGYVAMSNTGQIYAFNVTYHTPATYNAPMVGVAVNSAGTGYMTMSNKGQLYAYGVTGHSNPTGYTPPMSAVAITSNGAGALAMSSSGQMYAYSPVIFRGNADPGTAVPAQTVQEKVVGWAWKTVYANGIPSTQGSRSWPAGQPVPYSYGAGHGATLGPSYGIDQGAGTLGVDCGGFTRWMYGLATGSDPLNFALAAYQENNPHFTTTTSPVPGDLVLFWHQGDANSHHVGIYIGNDQMIDALQTGTNVRVDSVSGVQGSDTVGYRHYTG